MTEFGFGRCSRSTRRICTNFFLNMCRIFFWDWFYETVWDCLSDRLKWSTGWDCWLLNLSDQHMVSIWSDLINRSCCLYTFSENVTWPVDVMRLFGYFLPSQQPLYVWLYIVASISVQIRGRVQNWQKKRMHTSWNHFGAVGTFCWKKNWKTEMVFSPNTPI